MTNVSPLVELSPITVPAAGSPPASIRGNLLWTTLGNVVYAASLWGMTIVLAKLDTPEAVGRLALAFAVTSPIFLLSNLQLRAVQATDAGQVYNFREYFSLRAITTLLAVLTVAVVALSGIFDRRTLPVILAVALAKTFECFSDVIYGRWQGLEQMRRISKSLALRGLTSLIALALVFVWTHSLSWAALAMALTWGAMLAIHDRRGIPPPSGPQPQFAQLLRLAAVALPLGAVAQLHSLNTNIPRYFLERCFGPADLGLFSATAYIMAAGATLITAAGQTVVPRLAKYHLAQDWPHFNALSLRLIAFGLGAGGAGFLIASVAGRQLLLVLYTARYAEHIDVFLWLMAAAAANYVVSCFCSILTAALRFRFQAGVFFAITIVTVALSWLLVPSAGMVGAAQSLLFASIIQLSLTGAGVLDVIRQQRKHAC